MAKSIDKTIIGTWHLKSLYHQDDKGRKIYPFGKKPKGILIYCPDGWMSALIAKESRLRFQSSGLFEGKPNEKISAFEGFTAYAGKYQVSNMQVRHRVKISLFPNWETSIQVRVFKIKNGALELSTKPFVVNGKNQVARLIWRR